MESLGGEQEGQTSSIRQVALASFIGTTIEWYDFFLYGTAAALDKVKEDESARKVGRLSTGSDRPSSALLSSQRQRPSSSVKRPTEQRRLVDPCVQPDSRPSLAGPHPSLKRRACPVDGVVKNVLHLLALSLTYSDSY